ncbi:uncharacterized protein [Apostichopus japonicus]|uniref:uncharacterized protein n=1 Tax=Stichopus japonicus TaxID=307972 RepID=UPI003AB7FF97
MGALRQNVIICAAIIIFLKQVRAQPPLTLFLVSHYPETGHSSPLYIYGLSKYAFDVEAGVEASITKDGGLPSDRVQVGTIDRDLFSFGCYLRVDELNRFRGLRYGQYTGAITVGGNVVYSGYTFVKPKTALLDTRGVRTVTIYPKSMTSNELEEKVSIGVGWSPGCKTITWSKGKKRNVNTGPRLNLKTTDDAGLYTIRRKGRAKIGSFVQILIIAATCPRTYWFNEDTKTCMKGTYVCRNGGVLANNLDYCICPTFLLGDQCDCFADDDGNDLLITHRAKIQPVSCRELPGGNPTCRGHLVCFGDNYGCECSSGWHGNACDRACPKGKWGDGCKQRCPNHEPDCNRFYGPSKNLIKNGCTL